MSTFSVDVYVDDIPVKRYYGIKAFDADAARQFVENNLILDFSVEEDDE